MNTDKSRRKRTEDKQIALRIAASAFLPAPRRGSATTNAEDHQGPADEEALRAALRSEVQSLKTLVAKAAGSDALSFELARIRAALDELTPAPKRDRTAAWVRSVGVEGPMATKLATLVKGAEGTAPERLRAAIAELVPTAPFWDSASEPSEDDVGDGDDRGRRAEGPRVVAVVGPSGVGKTTTVAKLAAQARMDGKTVALVSCDGFRVGAVDQLERYAELLSAEMFVARAPVELAETLDDLLERPEGAPDMIFVDTSGRPPTTHSPEHALAGWIARARSSRRDAEAVAAGEDAPRPTLEVLLCVAASTRANDARALSSTFAPVSPTGVVVTKTDETSSPAALVHAPWAAKKPLVCICHGPRVPEDACGATPDAIARFLETSEPMPSNNKKEGTS
jgi:flagellar biosynthesis protein FlhF